MRDDIGCLLVNRGGVYVGLTARPTYFECRCDASGTNGAPIGRLTFGRLEFSRLCFEFGGVGLMGLMGLMG